jgi:hypothetical protein
MSNPAIRYETTVIFCWAEGSGRYGIQLLRDGSLAKVDEHLSVIKPLTKDQAREIKERIGEDPEGYYGSPPKARFLLGTHDQWADL